MAETPADLIGSIGNQAQDPTSLVESLRGRGNLPLEALAMLMAQQPQVNPYAMALAGGVSAMRGQPNPVLEQAKQQQLSMTGPLSLLRFLEDQKREQRITRMEQQRVDIERQRDIRLQDQANRDYALRIDQFNESVAARKEASENANEQKILTILDTFGKSDDPNMRKVWLQQVTPILNRRLKGDISGPLKDLESADLRGEPLHKVIGMLDGGMQPDDIAEQTGYPLKSIQSASVIAGNDSVRSAMKIPTRQESEVKRIQAEEASLKLAKERFGLDPKNPVTNFALKYAMDTFQKPFDKLTLDQQKEAVEKGSVMAVKTPAPTTLVKNALAEFDPMGDPKDPLVVRRAVNAYHAKRQKEKLDQVGMAGQLSSIGKQYSAELGRAVTEREQYALADNLYLDMLRLIEEGKSLGLTGDMKALNKVKQEIQFWTGGAESKAMKWMRAWDTLDARFGTVAKAVERITGNRLALQNTVRALGFHPKISDPYGVQLRVAGELKKSIDAGRAELDQALSSVQRQYQGAAGAAGIPFILGGGSKAVSAEEEEE